jgi:hypothetical protein
MMTAVFALPCLAAATEADQLAVIDWSDWHAMLATYVVEGRVDYDAFASDRRLQTTVAAIAEADLRESDSRAQLSFYINAYNVLVVQAILDGRSPRTNLGKFRFFYREKFTIAGERLSLHALEKRRIRSFGDPRIHFAIVCASASCPHLRSEAYVPERLDCQLDDNTRRFLNDPQKNRFDLESGLASVSKIFKWFGEDFELDGQGVDGFLAQYVDDEGVAEALRSSRLKIRYLEYDWSLNGSFESHSAR